MVPRRGGAGPAGGEAVERFCGTRIPDGPKWDSKERSFRTHERVEWYREEGGADPAGRRGDGEVLRGADPGRAEVRPQGAGVLRF